MRHFFHCAIPYPKRVLFVESGSRSVLEEVIVIFRRIFRECEQIDVITCYAGIPEGVNGRVFRVADYPTPEARQQLYTELAGRDYQAIGILCTAEPIMTKWKFALAARVPAKLLVVNENADFFWFDRANFRGMFGLMLFRAGMTGASAVPTLARLLFLPLTAAYLLAYAAVVHLRRRLRSLNISLI